MGTILTIITWLLLTSNFYMQTMQTMQTMQLHANNTDSHDKNIKYDGTVIKSTKTNRSKQNNNTADYKEASTYVLPIAVNSTVQHSNSRIRNNKRLNALQAKRNVVNRDFWKNSRKSNSTTLVNDRYAVNLSKNSSRNIGLRSTIKLDVSVRNTSSIANNSIVEPVEEYLQMGESVYQMYNISSESLTPIVPDTTSVIPILTKELRNYVNIDRTKNRSKPTRAMVEATTIKTTKLYYDIRQKHNRGKTRFMPQKSSYDSELIQFAIYGQKATPTPKSRITTTQSRNINRKRGSLPKATDNNGINDENNIGDKQEILNVSIPPRPSSSEKAKIWRTRFEQVTRNAVAYNDFVRRHPMFSANIKLDPTLKIIQPTTLRPRTTTGTNVGLNPINNYIEGTVEPKELFLRSVNLTHLDTTTEMIPVETTTGNIEAETVSQKVSGLIINIPDDATPEENVRHDLTLHSNSQINHAHFYTTTPSLTSSLEIVTTINVIEEVGSEQEEKFMFNMTRSRGRNLSYDIVTSKNLKNATTITTTTPITTTVVSHEIPETSSILTNVTSEANVVYDQTNLNTSSSTSTASTMIFSKISSSTTPPDTNYQSPNPPTAQHPSKTFKIVHKITNENPTNNDVTIEVDKMNIATYVMIVLAMVPVAAIILHAIRIIVSNRDNKNNLDNLDNLDPISPVVKLDSDTVSNSTDESVLGHDSMMFNRNNLRFKSLLGEGNFGQVWKAEIDDVRGHLQGTMRVVAVKTERRDNGQGGLKAEAEIMRKLGSSHINVVKLLGACIEQEPHLIIMEYAMRGRLLSLLRAARGGRNSLPQTLPSRPALMPMSPRTLTGFSLDIAKGMEYIASKKIVHRDLAARNILLDHNGICKICDFGMSIDLDKDQESYTVPKIPRVHHESRFKFDFACKAFNGAARQWDAFRNQHSDNSKHDSNKNNRHALPIRWMAPEALQYHIYSTKTDIFAFGIVLWEIATLGCTPYPHMAGREVIRNVIHNNIRPEIPSDCRKELHDLMKRAWLKDPNERVSFTEARQILHRTICQWQCDDISDTSDYMDVSGFSEDLENGMVYFNRRVSEFECDI